MYVDADAVKQLEEVQRIANLQELIQMVQEQYLTPGLSNLEVSRQVLNALRDCVFVAHSLYMADKFASNNNANTYAYYFNHRTEALGGSPVNEVQIKAMHSSELPYVFGTVVETGPTSYTNNEVQLSKSMMEAWGSFAKTG